MSRSDGWLVHHFLALIAAGIVLGGVFLTYLSGRDWYLLLLLPAALAGAAWYAWEFSAEATPFVVAIAVLGYLGLAIGAFARRIRSDPQTAPGR